MASNFTRLYYHFIWSTRGRQPLITGEMEEPLLGYLRHKCQALGVLVYAVNGMPDHLHLACSLPTHLSIADFLEAIKGSSAHFINHLPDRTDRLYWQAGYGAMTFAKSDLSRVVACIDNQKRHHENKKLSPSMEQCSE